MNVEELELPLFSFSQLGTWDKCQEYWKLSYIDKWTPIEKRTYFELGSLCHELLAVFYAAFPHKSPGEAWGMVKAYLAERMKDTQHRESLETFRTAARLMERYIYDFSSQKDKGWTIVEIEKHLEVQLVTPAGRSYILEGIIDLLVVDRNGRLWLIDHKTGTRFWSQMGVVMDPQLPTYAAILRSLGNPVFGTMVNMLNSYDYKKPGQVETPKLFRRESAHQGDKELTHILFQTGLAVDEVLAAKDRYLNDPDRAFRKSLSRDCEKCTFQEVCWFGGKGVPVGDILRAKFMKKEPRADRVKEAQQSDADV